MNKADFITVGIDVSKDMLDVCILPNNQVMHIANTKKGFYKLFQILEKQGDISRVVLEHTGGYQKPCALYLQEKGLPLSVVNPAMVRHFAKGIGYRAKTDVIDAEVLAMFGTMQNPALLPKIGIRTDDIRSLSKRKEQLTGMLTAEKNRLDKHPSKDAKQSITKTIRFLQKELDAIKKTLHDQVKSDEHLSKKVEIIASVKGIGSDTAAVLLSEVPELGTMNRGQAAALVGLAPINRDSGKKHGHAFIQAGRKSARNALYMPAMVAARCNPVLKDHYNQMVERGKPKKLALTAVMRKLIVHVNALIAKNYPTVQNIS